MDSTESDLFDAWVAGFFDGGGCITISPGKRYGATRFASYKVHIGIVQAEPQHRPLYDIQDRWGGRIYQRQQQAHWKRQHTLNFTAQREVHAFLTAMLPHLRIKHAKAVEALAVIGEPCRGRGRIKGSKNVPLTHCRRGHEYSADNTLFNPKTGFRACRTCNREGARLWRQAKKDAGLCCHCRVRPIEGGPNNSRCAECRRARAIRYADKARRTAP